MCAICICPYEEGDIRIFSPNCSHVFHKDCILEWLVKGHNECPCCRIAMVSKTEIKETSASLLGTERLAQAMAVVNESEMREAPPFRRRAWQARQMLARARAQRRRSGLSQVTGDRALMPPQSPNRDWLWATRFSSSSSNISQPRTINPSRSSDAIMNPHETNQNATTSTTASPAAPEASMHDSTAGSLFSSTMYHDHWYRQSPPNRRRVRDQTVTLSPTRLHAHWRQNAPTSNLSADLPVTVRPPI
ncbi:hypothetical protein ACHAXR_003230 [Thalassiosira sp. AJA248-18]